jgi:hypothetical protein
METRELGCLPGKKCKNSIGVVVAAAVVGRNEGNQVLHGYWLCREIMKKYFQFEPDHDPEILVGEPVFVDAFTAL